jgi:septal ring factor EnvC (AmiA/AmiB activator)
MSFRRSIVPIRFAAAVIATVGLVAAMPLPSSADPSLGDLNSQLGQVQAQQASLSASIASLSGLISSLDGQIALVESREAQVRAELARDRVELAATKRALARERRLLAILRARLAHARFLLARQLVSSYEGDQPDLISVVLEAHGFNQLLEQVDFLKRAERQQQSLIALTKAAKARATVVADKLARLEKTQQQITEATLLRVQALAGMNGLLHAKEGALQQARAAKQSALAASHARGQQLQSEISQVEAQQAAAEAAANTVSSSSPGSGAGTGPGVGAALGSSGGWAIPYPIVLCESGGQNLPPNSAGASGYYQIIPGTWSEYGGTGPAAYLAPKSEQDAVASRIWAGSGPSAWVCAGIVGIQ